MMVDHGMLRSIQLVDPHLVSPNPAGSCNPWSTTAGMALAVFSAGKVETVIMNKHDGLTGNASKISSPVIMQSWEQYPNFSSGSCWKLPARQWPHTDD